MDPLELIIKTLIDWQEKDLATKVLETFSKKAITFEQYDQIAKIAFETKNYSLAIQFGEKTLPLCPTEEHAYVNMFNLINVYNKHNYPDKAFPLMQRCKKIHPDDDDLIMEESFMYSALNQKDQCEEILFQILDNPKASKKNKDVAWHNLSGHYFRQDNIVEGLHHYLREEEKDIEKEEKYKKWDGTVTPGKTIVINTKCGAGDEVIHVRFMKHLRDLGMNPVWTTNRQPLINVFNYNGYDSYHMYEHNDFPEDSEWVYALAIPYYLKLTSKDLWDGPYLRPLPEKEEKWKWISEDAKFKIGMFWASSSGFEQAHFRNTYLKDYMSILGESGHSLYSLQMHFENEETKQYPEIITIDDEDRDFSDTFSIINQMDLVITSCTSIAHIAASMGKEVCVFVPILDYYIWEHSGPNTYWYGDNVHLFRQTKPRVWDEQMIEFKQFLIDKGLL